MQNEKLVAPADNHNTMGQFTPSVHGFNSSVQVSFPGLPIPLNERVIATRQEMAAEFPFNWDMNNGDVLGICVPRYTSSASTPLISSHILFGVGWAQATIGHGTRSSLATAFFAPPLSRTNLNVLINAQVTKLMQTGIRNGKPSFHSVNFAAQEGCASSPNTAKNTLILTPHIQPRSNKSTP